MSLEIHTAFETPPTGQMITRFDYCPCFSERRSLLAIDHICWFCRFADFDLFSDKLPESGICKYPEEQESEGKEK